MEPFDLREEHVDVRGVVQEVLSSLVRELTVKAEEGFSKMGFSCCKTP